MKLENKNIVNYLLIISPLIFIFGPFISNLYIFFLFLSCFFFKSFKIKINSYELIFLIFLIYIFLQTLYLKNFDALPRVLFISIFSYIFFVSKHLDLSKYQKKSFKFVFYTLFSILFLFFLYFIFFQFNFDTIQRFSAFFGEEKILGSYLSKFFLLIICLYFLSKNNNLNNRILIPYIFICLIFMIFSVERMALIMFLFNLLVYFFLKKQFLKISVLFSIISVIILSIYSFIPESKSHFVKFFADTGIFHKLSHNYSTSAIRNQKYIDNPDLYLSKELPEDKYAANLDVTKKRLDDRRNNINQEKIIYFFDNFHGSLILNSITILKNNFLIGIGIKQFREVCEFNVLNFNDVDYTLHCSTHPHNIYVEILLETGLLGFCLFLIFLISFFYNIFKKINYKSDLHCSLISLIITITFPLQSTGSFFSSRYIFFYFITFIFINTFILSNKK